MMLVWLITTEVWPRPRSIVPSNSRPTRNMNRMSPTWLNMLISPSESRGKTAAASSGAASPSTDGPSTMPATISAITIGWRMRRASSPIRRATLMISSACTMKRASGVWRSGLMARGAGVSRHWVARGTRR